MTARLIGLAGLKGAGKSEVAYRLASGLRAYRFRFSGPLKDMLRAIGLTDEHIEGSLKEKPCDLLMGATPRHAMVTLGTEWGREMIHKDLWLHLWRMKTLKSLQDGYSVITEDVRFPNEAQALRAIGGIIIRVERPGLVAGDHESEQHALTIPADIICHNDGDLSDLWAWASDVAPAEIERAARLVSAA